jgi:hypothetical protein
VVLGAVGDSGGSYTAFVVVLGAYDDADDRDGGGWDSEGISTEVGRYVYDQG